MQKDRDLLEAVTDLERRIRESDARLARVSRSSRLSDGDVRGSLREITEAACEILALARSSVWVYGPDQRSIRCLDLFVAAEATHDAGTELFAADFPGYFEALKSERSIAAADAHTDPRTREFSVPYLAPLGIGAMLDAPIRVGGRMIGVLCNEHVGQARPFTVLEEHLAGVLADYVAIAVLSSERKSAEEQLRVLAEELERLA